MRDLLTNLWDGTFGAALFAAIVIVATMLLASI